MWCLGLLLASGLPVSAQQSQIVDTNPAHTPRTAPASTLPEQQSPSSAGRTVAGSKPRPPFIFPGPPDRSLWFRYLQAGYDAQGKGDDQLAKKYFLASLTELEKNPPAAGKDIITIVKISTLERHLRESYPTDWSSFDSKPEQAEKLRTEQIDTLRRIVKVNERCVPANDSMRTGYVDLYQRVKSENEKWLKEHSQHH